VRILQINKYLFPRDGVTTVVAETIRLLEERGHQVAAFGQADPAAFPAASRGAVVDPIFLDRPASSLGARLACLGRLFFSTGARAAFSRLLAAWTPDVVHLHNIYHHLGAPIIGIAKRHGVPVVMTLHDYKPFCPDYLFLRAPARESTLCTSCLRHGPFDAVRFRCVRDSRAASLVCWLEAVLHRRFYCRVDRFLAPSRFMAQKAREAGVPARRIAVVRNPAPAAVAEGGPRAGEPADDAPAGGEILFLGRLYREKGAALLVRAFARLGGVANAAGGLRLTVAGEGPERQRVERLGRGLAVHVPGFLDGPRKAEAIRRAAVIVFPSTWYENGPMTILEAFSAGKAVVASRIGGIPEMVVDNETGLLVTPGNEEELASALSRLLADPALRERLGRAARERAATLHAPPRYAAKLERAYRRVLNGNRPAAILDSE
jgi:glycosyltransferase involved in cell wall biosynthesis